MSDRIGSAAGVPLSVSIFTPVAKVLLAAGLPMGFSMGSSPFPAGRAACLARRPWRSSSSRAGAGSGRPWGDVHWVLNLRDAGRATIAVRRRKEDVTATELDATQRVAFFRDTLGPVARGIPFGIRFIRIVDRVDLNHPVEAAEGRPVFELHPRR